MTEQKRGYLPIAVTALNDLPAYHRLPPEAKEMVAQGVVTLILATEAYCQGRWNRLRWYAPKNSVLLETNDWKAEPLDQTAQIDALKQIVREHGISGKSADGIVVGAYKRSVFMLQAGVDTIEELNRYRRRFKTGRGGGEAGRTFHTHSPIAPANTFYTSLRNLPPFRPGSFE